MLRRLLLVLLVLAVPAFVLPGTSQAKLDPKLEWHTIETERFIIHYYEGEELIAKKVADLSGPVFEKVTTAVGWTPKGKIHVVLSDETDSANGYAVSAPNNMIRMYVTAPTDGSSLSLYSDWVEMLFTHELTHIVHIDMIGGLPRVLRAVFGSVVDYNQMQPRWIVEGYATYLETELTEGGRGRSTFTDMLIRTAVLEDNFPRIDQANGEMASWPSGYVPYLFGVAFHEWLREKFGDEKIREYNKRYSSSLIPYNLNHHSKKVFGESFPKLWEQWADEMEDKYGELVTRLEEEEVTHPERLTNHGRRVGGPRFGPENKLIYSTSDGNSDAEIIVMNADGTEPETIKERYYTEFFSWSPDGKHVAFNSRALYEDFYSWSEVYTMAVDGGGMKQITSGVRGRQPEYKPDGTEIFFISNNLGNNDLAVTRIDDTVRYLTDHRDFTQYSTPRFKPDGSQIAVSAWFPGGYRDIVLLDADGQNPTRLTMDLHIDRDPTWSPDGRFLIFASDRTGISNLYAYEPDTGTHYRITNVLTGAFQPTVSPDKKWIAFQGYHSRGYDIYRIPYDPESWTEVGWTYDSGVYGVGCTDNEEYLSEPVQASADGGLTDGGGTNGDKEDCGPGVQVPRTAEEGADNPGHTAATTANVSGGIALDAAAFAAAVEADAADAAKEELKFPLMERPNKSENIDLSEYSERNYKPWKTLLPRYWLPGQFYVTESGATIGAYTGGYDPIYRHSYSVWLNYNTDSQYVGGGAVYSYNRWRPRYYIGANTYAVNYGSTVARTFGSRGQNPANEFIGYYYQPEDYFERRINAYAGVFFPYKKRHYIGISYRYENRTNLNALSPSTFEEYVPVRGNFGSLNIGYTLSDVRYYRFGISPVRGYRIAGALEIFHPYLGSSVRHPEVEGDYEKAVGTFDIRGYPKVPGTRHWVIGLRATGGLAVGDTFYPPTFRLGGALGESSLVVTTSNYYSLRGYPFFASLGEAFAIGSAELRFPLYRVERGWSTWPVFLKNVHAAVFTDIGDAWYWDEGDPFEPRFGVGGEIRANFNFVFYYPLTVRAGYAYGIGTLRADGTFDVTDNGLKSGAPGHSLVESFYWTVGTSF